MRRSIKLNFESDHWIELRCAYNFHTLTGDSPFIKPIIFKDKCLKFCRMQWISASLHGAKIPAFNFDIVGVRCGFSFVKVRKPHSTFKYMSYSSKGPSLHFDSKYSFKVICIWNALWYIMFQIRSKKYNVKSSLSGIFKVHAFRTMLSENISKKNKRKPF